MQLNERSERALLGVHDDLVRVVRRAAELCPIGFEFFVTEGLRTQERQVQLFKQGATRTMRSRHRTGHAVDLAIRIGGEVRWDWPLFHRLADIVKQAASDEKVPLTWGGDWETFKDGPHFELPRNVYPAAAGTET